MHLLIVKNIDRIGMIRRPFQEMKMRHYCAVIDSTLKNMIGRQNVGLFQHPHTNIQYEKLRKFIQNWYSWFGILKTANHSNTKFRCGRRVTHTEFVQGASGGWLPITVVEASAYLLSSTISSWDGMETRSSLGLAAPTLDLSRLGVVRGRNCPLRKCQVQRRFVDFLSRVVHSIDCMEDVNF